MVEGEEGPILQRNGNFTINLEGQLVNHRGQTVLSEAGPLEIPDRERMIIDQDGVVRTDQGGEIGRLRLVDAGGGHADGPWTVACRRAHQTSQ